MPNPTKQTAARSRRRKTLAQLADRNDLYQRAVQCVEAEIDFVDDTYKKLRGKRATLLREDFCGTANTSCEWVRRRPDNIAVGIDIDPKQLAWGERHNLSELNDEQRARVRIRNSNVLTAGPYEEPGAKARGFDAVLAMNFSYWCLKTRELMLRYFRAVHASLAKDGVFFLDFYGGSDAFREMTEPRRVAGRRSASNPAPPFTYVWDQSRYDPISGDSLCYIHFRFADGSEKKRAFRYDWRLWTIPELRDLLAEAGFGPTTVYWEGDDNKGSGNGIFRPATRGEACASFIAYIVAER